MNHIHVAVAFDYDEKKTPLPVVLAKGTALSALRMVEAVTRSVIPSMHTMEPANALCRDSVEDACIPADRIVPAVEDLRRVRPLGPDGGRAGCSDGQSSMRGRG